MDPLGDYSTYTYVCGLFAGYTLMIMLFLTCWFSSYFFYSDPLRLGLEGLGFGPWFEA